MADSYDLSVIRGDTVRWNMNLKDSAGATYILTGSTLSMQVRSGHYPANLVASYSIYIGAGTTLATLNGTTGGIAATGTGGTINVCIGSNYTKLFSAYTPVFYDIQEQTNSSNTITLLQGKIDTILDVTNT